MRQLHICYDQKGKDWVKSNRCEENLCKATTQQVVSPQKPD